MTPIQRFGGALDINVHFHLLALDNVYVERPDGTLRLRRVEAPTSAGLDAPAAILAHRIGCLLEPPGARREAPLADPGRQGPLPLQDPQA